MPQSTSDLSSDQQNQVKERLQPDTNGEAPGNNREPDFVTLTTRITNTSTDNHDLSASPFHAFNRRNRSSFQRHSRASSKDSDELRSSVDRTVLWQFFVMFSISFILGIIFVHFSLNYLKSKTIESSEASDKFLSQWTTNNPAGGTSDGGWLYNSTAINRTHGTIPPMPNR